MLTDCTATAFAAANDTTVAVCQIAEQFDILVVDVQRPRPLAVREDRILLFRFLLILCPAVAPRRLSRSLSGFLCGAWSWSGHRFPESPAGVTGFEPRA